MSGKTVLVAGGAGFVGSHLCDRLIGAGARVICVDNLQTGRLGNIVHLMQRRQFRFIRQDVTQPLALDGPVDAIFNLAGPGSPARIDGDPIEAFRTCVMGAMNLLDLAVAKGARILQASTAGAGATPPRWLDPLLAAGRPAGPHACLDEGKRAAEALFRQYRALRGVDIRVARIFDTYGPRMRVDDGRPVPNLIVQALTGAPLTLGGADLQLRSFCYVDDLVDGLMRLMDAEGPLPEPVDLGHPALIPMHDLARRVLARTRSRSRIGVLSPPGIPAQRAPDLAPAWSRLGWSAGIDLDEGLDRTVPHFAEVIQPRMAGV